MPPNATNFTLIAEVITINRNVPSINVSNELNTMLLTFFLAQGDTFVKQLQFEMAVIAIMTKINISANVKYSKVPKFSSMNVLS